MADGREKALLTILAAGIAAVIILKSQRRKRRTRVVSLQRLFATPPPLQSRGSSARLPLADHLPRPRQVGIIPARYESTRFPGKPLTPILGVPMIIRTYRQALKAAALHAVVVATDDERIAEVCRAAGAEVVMTSTECPNGGP